MINLKENIKDGREVDGFIAIDKLGKPKFVYDGNVIIPFADQSYQSALSHDGKAVTAIIQAFFPNGEEKAIIKNFRTKVTKNLDEHFAALKEKIEKEIPLDTIKLIFYSGWNAGIIGDPRGPEKVWEDICIKHQIKQNV